LNALQEIVYPLQKGLAEAVAPQKKWSITENDVRKDKPIFIPRHCSIIMGVQCPRNEISMFKAVA